MLRRRYPPDARKPSTLIGPSALAQTNRQGSIHGQKEELRDVVRRPPCTARLTATDSAPPPRESAMGRSRYGPSGTVTTNPQLYWEVCFTFLIVFAYGQRCMRASLFMGQWMSPVRQISCKEIEMSLRRYRVRIKSPCSHRTIPQTNCTASPLEQVAGFPSAE